MEREKDKRKEEQMSRNEDRRKEEQRGGFCELIGVSEKNEH
ncbi:MAG TPA: hypothetical protein PK733_12890 [Clostridiales bacterium]|nr:hypothetical protein [Clostridiales bacterium]